MLHFKPSFFLIAFTGIPPKDIKMPGFLGQDFQKFSFLSAYERMLFKLFKIILIDWLYYALAAVESYHGNISIVWKGMDKNG